MTPSPTPTESASPTPTITPTPNGTCGDSVIDFGEDCDDGVDNGTNNCCSATCTVVDLDGDTICDRDDDEDAVLTISRARVRRSSSPTGRILVKGELILNGPNDTFDTAQGIVVQVLDGSTLDESFLFGPSDCQTLGSGLITCRSGDRTLKGLFVPRATPTPRFRFTVRFRKLTITGPFGPPLTTRITSDPPLPVDGIDRVGTISNCFVTTNGMRCRTP